MIRVSGPTLAVLLGMPILATAQTADPGPWRIVPDPVVGLSENDILVMNRAISACWVVEPGSAASKVAVTVGLSLSREGRVLAEDLALLAHTDASPEAVEDAFRSASGAILRCQGDGYDLSPEQYDYWRDVEMTFDPSGMAVR